MSNSVLSNVFPLRESSCPNEQGDSQSEDSQSDEIFLCLRDLGVARKKPNPNLLRLGVLNCTDTSSMHDTSFLFAGAISNAAAHKRSLFLTRRRLDAIPKSVHSTPELRACAFECGEHLALVYPKDELELLRYLAALGGAASVDALPQFIALQGIDSFPTANRTATLTGYGLRERSVPRIMAALHDLAVTIVERTSMPLDVLVSLGDSTMEPLDKLHLWATEVWQVRSVKTQPHLQQEHIQLVCLTSKPNYRLNVSLERNQYFISTFTVDKE